MIVQPANYADFVTVVTNFRGIENVFYYAPVGHFFAHAMGRAGYVITSGDLGSTPGAFSTDFPAAISLTANLVFA